MLILLTIFLFIFSPLAMLILRMARPRLSIQGFLAVLTVLAGLVMVFLSRADIPQEISLFQWKPGLLYSLSPSLLIDDISWYFALALAALTFSVVITSIAQLGQSIRLSESNINPIKVVEASTPAENVPPTVPAGVEAGTLSNWQFWAAVMILTSLGILAVTSGNLLTLLLAWTALDMIELAILLSHVLQSKIRERAILVFSANMAGMVTLLFAGLFLWSQGDSLSFDGLSQSTSLIMVIAVGIRSGVLPLQLPFTEGLPIRRGLGTALRLIPAAANYILLVRVASVGIPAGVIPYLLILSDLAGLYAVINWLRARDELKGRPYWMLGAASLTVAAAILGQPTACLAWSIASLLSGGFIFSMILRHRNLFPLVVVGALILSSLPFSPTWQGSMLLQTSSSIQVSQPLLYLSSFIFILLQSFLLAGFIRHGLRGVFPEITETSVHIERWVWFLYPIALVLLVIIHVFIGISFYPDLEGLSVFRWVSGPVIILITTIILYISWRYHIASYIDNISFKSSFWNSLFSLDWFYRLLWQLFRTASRGFALFSSLLEGDGGILWALVLFALIFVFLQR